MRGHVLILDDNPMDVRAVTIPLQKMGYAVAGFTDHKEALNWIAENTPQFIFLDLQLPETTGFELIPIFKKHSNTAKTPIVIISGKNQTDDVKKAISLGAADYIVKAIDPLVVQEKARRIESASESEFFSVDLPDNDANKAFFAKPLKILSVSEFGLVALSDYEIKVGETVDISGLQKDFFGNEKLIVRCLSSSRSDDQNSYKMQFTYVGITEPQRQTIRKSCRQVWIAQKEE